MKSPAFAGAVELRNTLGEKFGIELPPSLALDFPTASAIAGHIAPAAAVMSSTTEGFDRGPRRAQQGGPSGAAAPTAIAGLSARFPGGADSAAQFWGSISSSANLQDQVNHVEHLSNERYLYTSQPWILGTLPRRRAQRGGSGQHLIEREPAGPDDAWGQAKVASSCRQLRSMASWCVLLAAMT